MARRISHVRAARDFGRRLGCTRDPRWLIMLAISERLDAIKAEAVEVADYALAHMAKELRAITRDLEDAADKQPNTTAKQVYDKNAREWRIAPPREKEPTECSD